MLVYERDVRGSRHNSCVGSGSGILRVGRQGQEGDSDEGGELHFGLGVFGFKTLNEDLPQLVPLLYPDVVYEAHQT